MGDAMTCIAGIAERGRVWLAADSQSTGGWSARYRTFSKVYEKDGLVFGASGSPRDAQLVRFKCDIPTLADGRDEHEWVACDLVDAMRKCLVDGGALKKENGVETVQTHWLVGVAGRLFAVFGDFQVCERLEGYDAVGCGDEYAIGSLYSSRGAPSHRVVQAVGAACHFSAGVGGRIDVVSTRKVTR